MGRLFFKSLLNIFLWLILLVNLIYAFNLTSLLGFSAVVAPTMDYSDKYFGVSSLIDYFKSMDNSLLGGFLKTIKTWLDNIYSTANMLINSNWDAIGKQDNFIMEILNLLGAIWSTIAGIGTFIFGFAVYLVYAIGLLVNILFFVLGVFNGYIYKNIPVVTYPPLPNLPWL